jgi:hypothetical protein
MRRSVLKPPRWIRLLGIVSIAGVIVILVVMQRSAHERREYNRRYSAAQALVTVSRTRTLSEDEIRSALGEPESIRRTGEARELQWRIGTRARPSGTSMFPWEDYFIAIVSYDEVVEVKVLGHD